MFCVVNLASASIMATKGKRRSNIPKDPNSTEKMDPKAGLRKEEHPMAMDDIVDQILSLLPTKSAVYMSYLSKPWKVVRMVNCPSISVLHFDEGEPPHETY
ncbi:hypothetical protein M0R45_007790 [Rubus argutus]|uniref:Uncharacterized protein n=1 Tax=Rubus argutus TaxID=59490 RepID=A0AAW1Y0T7_RUBAR